MSARTHVRNLVSSLLLLVPVACSGGGGGGGGGAPVDLTGSWLVYVDVTGEEIGPFSVYLNQSGAVLDGVSITGTVSGNTFTATSQDFLGLGLNLSGTVNGTTAQGTLSIANTPITGAFRMTAFAPDGALVASGSVQSQSLNVNANIAAGGREYDDPARTNLTEIEVSFGNGDLYVELQFLPAGLGVGTKTVGSDITVSVEVADDMQSIEADASSGTVTISRYDGNGFAGTYSLTLAGGGTLTGSFDVGWDFESFEP